MNRVVRILACLPAAYLLANAMAWVLNPERAAVRIGMALLDESARGAQISITGTYFFIGALLALVGAWKAQPSWLFAAALLPGATAGLRLLAWGNHAAALATSSLLADLLMAAVLLLAAWWLRRERASDASST